MVAHCRIVHLWRADGLDLLTLYLALVSWHGLLLDLNTLRSLLIYRCMLGLGVDEVLGAVLLQGRYMTLVWTLRVAYMMLLPSWKLGMLCMRLRSVMLCDRYVALVRTVRTRQVAHMLLLSTGGSMLGMSRRSLGLRNGCVILLIPLHLQHQILGLLELKQCAILHLCWRRWSVNRLRSIQGRALAGLRVR